MVVREGRWVRCEMTDLVHASVGEEESGVIEGDGRGRWHEGVILSLEVVEELLANCAGRPGTIVGGHCASRWTTAEKR
mgnify:CR=1 FL=1